MPSALDWNTSRDPYAIFTPTWAARASPVPPRRPQGAPPRWSDPPPVAIVVIDGGNIREAIQQHVASLLAHGRPVPQAEHLVHVEELTLGIGA